MPDRGSPRESDVANAASGRIDLLSLEWQKGNRRLATGPDRSVHGWTGWLPCLAVPQRVRVKSSCVAATARSILITRMLPGMAHA